MKLLRAADFRCALGGEHRSRLGDFGGAFRVELLRAVDFRCALGGEHRLCILNISRNSCTSALAINMLCLLNVKILLGGSLRRITPIIRELLSHRYIHAKI